MKLNKYDSPCKECPDRYVGCHSVCNKYIDYSLLCAKEREERQKESRRYDLLKKDDIKRNKSKRHWKEIFGEEQ